MMTGLLTVSFFLLTLIFTLILFLLWTRVFLRYIGLSSLHPVSQTIFALTNPILAPIERRIYSASQTPARYDGAGFGLIIVIEFLKFICLGLLAYGTFLPIGLLVLFVIADLIVQPLNLLFYALLIRVIMSWINPEWHRNPVAQVVDLLTDPLIKIGHKLIPNISGFDFGPFIMLVILEVLALFISSSMPLPLL